MHRSFVPVRSSKYLLTLFMCSWMDSIMACDTVLKSKLPFISNTRKTSSPPYRLARFLNILTITSSLSSICSSIYSTQCCWSLLKMLLAVGPILSASVRGLHHLNPLQKPLGGASPWIMNYGYIFYVLISIPHIKKYLNILQSFCYTYLKK